jgi:hypothetical protein
LSISQTAALSRPGLMLDRIQKGLLWLMFAMGWLVIIEPSPSDLLFVPVVVVFLFSGLVIHATAAPLILFLLLYNLGGFISYLEVSNQTKASLFVITSFYMATVAMFLSFVVPADPIGRMRIIRNAWIIAAVIAATNGMIGYFNVFGMGAAWAPIWRAQGTFKDPNVLSTFLIPPAIFLIQGFLLGTQRWKLVSLASLFIILAGLFLAFSRGAWLNFLLCATLLVMVTFIVAEQKQLRTRIIILVILGVIAGVILLTALLSIPQVRDLFLMRASLVQQYDAGETGRFGNQLRSIPLLLEHPFGFGPTLFRDIFGQDPHNVYMNGFASYGWLGGFSYIVLCLSTIAVGWKIMFTRTPWQHISIAVFLPLLTTMLQGVQIDTDHWRHFYALLGLTWGLYGATVLHVRQVRLTGQAPPLAGIPSSQQGLGRAE